MIIVRSNAIRKAKRNSIDPTANANPGNPEVRGKRVSTTKKAGKAERLNINAVAIDSKTACPIVATLAVATAVRIVAVDPCGQSARIQKQPAKATARDARSPVKKADRKSPGLARRILSLGPGPPSFRAS